MEYYADMQESDRREREHYKYQKELEEWGRAMDKWCADLDIYRFVENNFDEMTGGNSKRIAHRSFSKMDFNPPKSRKPVAIRKSI